MDQTLKCAGTLEVLQDHVRDEIVINGIRYTRAFFRYLAFAPIGTRFEVVARRDGDLIVQDLKKL